jgi:hypothetical protein
MNADYDNEWIGLCEFQLTVISNQVIYVKTQYTQCSKEHSKSKESFLIIIN